MQVIFNVEVVEIKGEIKNVVNVTKKFIDSGNLMTQVVPQFVPHFKNYVPHVPQFVAHFHRFFK